MTKWIQHSKRLICEEKPENEEDDCDEEGKRNNMVAEVSVDNESISLDQNDI